MPTVPPAARRLLQRLIASFWKHFDGMAIQAQSDNDRIPNYKTPAAAEPTLQPTDPEPDELRQGTDDPPDPPKDKPTAK